MNLIILKTALAVLLLVTGSIAAGAMLSLQGRSEPPSNPRRLRALHRTFGYVFLAVLVVLAVFGAVILRSSGDALPLRGVIHWVLGSLLLLLALLKVGLVRRYKKFLKAAPALGLSTLVLAFLVAAVSAGFVLVTAGAPGSLVGAETYSRTGVSGSMGSGDGVGDVVLGERLYRANCAGCHLSDSKMGLVGPGLAGLLDREWLALDDPEAVREALGEQILRPTGTMPSFESTLSEEELSALIDYLETL